jgi:hypothetical protein
MEPLRRLTGLMEERTIAIPHNLAAVCEVPLF